MQNPYACKTVLRAEPFCAQNRFARRTVLRAEPFFAQNRFVSGTVLRAERNGTQKAGKYIQIDIYTMADLRAEQNGT